MHWRYSKWVIPCCPNGGKWHNKIANSGHKEVTVSLKKEAIKYHYRGKYHCLSGLLQETKYSRKEMESFVLFSWSFHVNWNCRSEACCGTWGETVRVPWLLRDISIGTWACTGCLKVENSTKLGTMESQLCDFEFQRLHYQSETKNTSQLVRRGVRVVAY